MAVSPSGSLIQALSNLLPQQPRPSVGAQNATPAKTAATDFRHHIEGVANKRPGTDPGTSGKQQHAANSAPPPPPPGRGSIINLLV